MTYSYGPTHALTTHMATLYHGTYIWDQRMLSLRRVTYVRLPIFMIDTFFTDGPSLPPNRLTPSMYRYILDALRYGPDGHENIVE